MSKSYPRWDPASWPEWLIDGMLVSTLIAICCLSAYKVFFRQ